MTRSLGDLRDEMRVVACGSRGAAMTNLQMALDQQPFPKVVVRARDVTDILAEMDALLATAEGCAVGAVAGDHSEAAKRDAQRIGMLGCLKSLVLCAEVDSIQPARKVRAARDLIASIEPEWDGRGFTEWKHEPDEFDRAADEDAAYRTRDASGCPTDAGNVAWNWISELAQQQRADDAALLVIQDTPVEGGGKVIRLYRSTTLLAVATTFRDDMNFTVLVRWVSPELRATAEQVQA